MNKRTIPLMTLAILVFSSCTPISIRLPASRNAWLSKWLTSPTCEPPCWENIDPGKTSITEASTLLEQMSNVRITRRGETRIEWVNDQTDSGWIIANDGLVISIALDIHQGEIVLLSEIADRYGPPLQVGVNSCEEGYCDVDLLYPKYKMVIGLLLPHGSKVPYTVTISSDSAVARISLFKDMEAYQISTPLSGGTVLEWKGYGDYP
jgi:hypothetical protein